MFTFKIMLKYRKALNRQSNTGKKTLLKVKTYITDKFCLSYMIKNMKLSSLCKNLFLIMFFKDLYWCAKNERVKFIGQRQSSEIIKENKQINISKNFILN